MDFAKVQYKSIYGNIRSEWYFKDNKFKWFITIPANTTATVYVPAEDSDKISEGGKPASESEGVRFREMENGRAVFEIASGNYTFIVNEN